MGSQGGNPPAFTHLDGQGSFGSVFKAMIADSGVVIAVKARCQLLVQSLEV